MTLAFLALAWLLGIAAAAFTTADPAASLAAAGLLAAASFAVRPRPGTPALVAAGAAVVFLAGWRYDSTLPPDEPTGIARHNGGAALRFRALVDAEPDDRGASRLYRLRIREALIDDGSDRVVWWPDSGHVLMRAASFPAYEYGDLLEVEGELETPPSFPDFDYREYLLRRGIASLIEYPEVRLQDHDRGSPLRAALFDVRHALTDGLREALPEPEASLAAGVLLGARTDLPRDLRDDMNATGTSHLVAVSGQNVTLIAGLLLAALAWLIGRRPAAWLSLLGIASYALLVGAQPSVLRAALMGALYVVAIAVGRQSSAAVGLVLAGAAMTAFDPQLARDVSFQLSFAATLGLITLAPLLHDRTLTAVERWPSLSALALTRPAVEMLAVTLAAIAFTLPITAVNFHRVSLVAPVANLFAVPAFLAVALTAAPAALAGAVFEPAADVLAWLAWPPAAYMITAVRLSADLPFASIELRGVGTGHAVAYYAALLGAVWLLLRQPAEPVPPPRVAPFRPRPLLPAIGLALILSLSSFLLWLALTTPASGRLAVTFLDVGQGDAVLIEGPAGQRILVDGGPSGEAAVAALGRRLPFYDRRLDLVVLSHPQADHLGGLPEVLARYDVAGVVDSPIAPETAAYRAWRDAVRAEGAPRIEAARGQWVDLGGEARLQVLAPAPGRPPPGDPNDASVVLKLTMGRVSLLLTGDIGADAEAALVQSGSDLRAAVLKVPHHGSDTSTSAEFVRRVQPLIDVISVAANNRYGLPSPQVLDRLRGDLVLRTDRHGDITVSTDGERLWITTQRRGD